MNPIFPVAAVVVVGLIVRAAWVAARPRCWFRIKLRRGEPVVVSGKMTPGFLAAIREVARQHGLKSGSVVGKDRAVGIGLDFSRHFPAEARQQLRNAWGYSGWKSKKPRW